MKLILLLSIVVICSFIGFSYGEEFLKRTNQLKELLRIVIELENEIVYSHTPLPECLKKIALKTKEPLKKLLEVVEEKLIKNEVLDVYDAFLRGIGEIGADNKARVIAKLIQIVLTVVLLFLNFGIISTSIANIVYGLAFRELCKKRFYSYKNMKTRLNEVGAVPISDIFETFKIVWHNAWREGIVSIANYISNQVTTLLCSLYLGLAATAKFGLAVQFTSAVAQIATALLISYQPALQEAYAHRNKEVISAKLSMGVISYVILYPLGLIGLMLFIPVINIIKGSAILTISLLFSVGFYQFILKFRDCYAWYLGSTNRVIYYKSFIFSSVLCTTLSVLFVGYWHLNISGFVYAQIISQLVFNVWYWPLYVHRELHLTLKNMILRFRVQLMRTIKEEI